MVVLKISSIKVDTLKFLFFSKNHSKHKASNSAGFHRSVERDVLKMIKGFIKTVSMYPSLTQNHLIKVLLTGKHSIFTLKVRVSALAVCTHWN